MGLWIPFYTSTHRLAGSAMVQSTLATGILRYLACPSKLHRSSTWDDIPYNQVYIFSSISAFLFDVALLPSFLLPTSELFKTTDHGERRSFRTCIHCIGGRLCCFPGRHRLEYPLSILSRPICGSGANACTTDRLSARCETARAPETHGIYRRYDQKRQQELSRRIHRGLYVFLGYESEAA
jgi:hypothetical protein